MTDMAAPEGVSFIHQIVPRSFHELVAKLRQETARADVLGEGGQPVIVIGVRFGMLRRDGAFLALLPLGFLVEGQKQPVWSAVEVQQHIKGTPAEAVLATVLRVATAGDQPLAEWRPPEGLVAGAVDRLALTVLGSACVLLAAGGAVTVCLQEPRTEMEGMELPLRTASDFRRFQALCPEAAAGGEMAFGSARVLATG